MKLRKCSCGKLVKVRMNEVSFCKCGEVLFWTKDGELGEDEEQVLQDQEYIQQFVGKVA